MAALLRRSLRVQRARGRAGTFFCAPGRRGPSERMRGNRYQSIMESFAMFDRSCEKRHCVHEQQDGLASFGSNPPLRTSHDGTPGWPLIMATPVLVSIVDDDESVRESLPDLVRQFGFAAEAFSSAEAFLASDLVNETRCLILDVGMPGMSGADLQRELKRRQQQIPIIFITATEDRSVRSRLLADGGVECLFKPFSDTALLDALTTIFPKR